MSVKKGQEVVKIFAPTIISDAGLFNTYERLLPAEARALPGKTRREQPRGVGRGLGLIGLSAVIPSQPQHPHQGAAL